MSREKALEAAVLSVQAAVNAYLPPDGISRDHFIERVLEAVDNPDINAALTPDDGDDVPAIVSILAALVGLALFGCGIDVMTRFTLPAFIGAPVVIGLMGFGLLLTIGSLGVLFDTPTPIKKATPDA